MTERKNFLFLTDDSLDWYLRARYKYQSWYWLIFLIIEWMYLSGFVKITVDLKFINSHRSVLLTKHIVYFGNNCTNSVLNSVQTK